MIGVNSGRRLTAAALEGRRLSVQPGRTVSRKELAAAARDCMKALRMRPALRLVLAELAGCWGEEEIGGKLLVWPSNDYLAGRTGLSERAVRYALRALADDQVIAAKDSPNKKRYRIAGPGRTPDAFGFDLSALIVRRGDWFELLEAQKAERARLAEFFDAITIARRSTEEALLALAQHYPDAKRVDLDRQMSALLSATPRRGETAADLPRLVDAWRALQLLVEQRFMDAADGGRSCRHKGTNNESPDTSWNKASEKEAEAVRPSEQPAMRPSASLIDEACPVLREHGIEVRDEASLVGAGTVLRSWLGASEDAWREAVSKIGALQAAGAVVFTLQLQADDIASGANRILNPGGYFRALARRIAAGQFVLETELYALRRRRMV